MAKYEGKKLFHFLGFLATILIALAILIAGIVNLIKFGQFTLGMSGLSFYNFQSALVCIANILAYFICMCVGFLYAKSKRNIAYLIIDIIAITIIIVVIVLNLFGV